MSETPKPEASEPPAPITFRRAGDPDRAAIEALQHAAYARNRALIGLEPLPLKEDYGVIMQMPDREVWLAEERGRLKGVLILEKRSNDLLIWSVAAAPEAQRQGLGQIMLDAAEVRAQQLGRKVIRLYTTAVLESLIRWYHRHGYEIEGHEDLSDRRITHMVKHLSPVG